MQRYTVYGGGYSQEHACIKMFWETVASLNEKEQACLLKFWTACSRPPAAGGFRYLEPNLCIQRSDGTDGRLPTASTCLNLLKLPPYSSRDEMAEKILYAIHSAKGFYLS
mmetsp:Transcript_3094/g.7579  ORF Transcript_3094/g.7579 Transcript_3094/m.7579 type:complete len:110 (-) Transcript_3094:111-440(-)